MTGSVWSSWFGWYQGGVWTNIVASAIWVTPTYFLALRHLHCVERGCFRPATVPVPDTVHKRCKKHASATGVTH